MTEAPSPDDRRVVVLNDARRYVGPALSRLLAARGHDLVVGEIEDSLAEELAALGASVEIVAGGRALTDPEAPPLYTSPTPRQQTTSRLPPYP